MEHVVLRCDFMNISGFAYFLQESCRTSLAWSAKMNRKEQVSDPAAKVDAALLQRPGMTPSKFGRELFAQTSKLLIESANYTIPLLLS
jgi:hypothetical protein